MNLTSYPGHCWLELERDLYSDEIPTNRVLPISLGFRQMPHSKMQHSRCSHLPHFEHSIIFTRLSGHFLQRHVNAESADEVVVSTVSVVIVIPCPVRDAVEVL